MVDGISRNIENVPIWQEVLEAKQDQCVGERRFPPHNSSKTIWVKDCSSITITKLTYASTGKPVKKDAVAPNNDSNFQVNYSYTVRQTCTSR